MFRASLCQSSGEQRPCYCIWCTALVLLDVVCSGCVALLCRMRAVLASYNAAPHNRYQPHPAEPAQYTICSNTVFVLLKIGIMMPETCWDRVNNEHLIVASFWSSLFHKIHLLFGFFSVSQKIFLIHRYCFDEHHCIYTPLVPLQSHNFGLYSPKRFHKNSKSISVCFFTSDSNWQY